MVRRARKLGWRRLSASEALSQLAFAEAMAMSAADRPDDAGAQRSLAEARVILAEGGMRLHEVYRDVSFPGSDLSLGRYEALARARWLTAVRVGRDGDAGLWWYRDAYYVAEPHAQPADIERFAHTEEREERRHLERFRTRVATMSSGRRSQSPLTPA